MYELMYVGKRIFHCRPITAHHPFYKFFEARLHSFFLQFSWERAIERRGMTDTEMTDSIHRANFTKTFSSYRLSKHTLTVTGGIVAGGMVKRACLVNELAQASGVRVNDELQPGGAAGSALGGGLPRRHSIQQTLHLGVGDVLQDEGGLITDRRTAPF